MTLRCPMCGSDALKKVSVAYEEGLQNVRARARIRGVVVGSDGPDLIVGRTATMGTQQTAISRALAPPQKWSYVKLCGWSILAFLSIGWMVFYVNAVITNSSFVSSVPLTIFAILSVGVFVALCLVYWKHNRTTYPRQYRQWDRSFLCQGCGAVIQHDLSGSSVS